MDPLSVGHCLGSADLVIDTKKMKQNKPWIANSGKSHGWYSDKRCWVACGEERWDGAEQQPPLQTLDENPWLTAEGKVSVGRRS